MSAKFLSLLLLNGFLLDLTKQKETEMMKMFDQECVTCFFKHEKQISI